MKIIWQFDKGGINEPRPKDDPPIDGELLRIGDYIQLGPGHPWMVQERTFRFVKGEPELSLFLTQQPGMYR